MNTAPRTVATISAPNLGDFSYHSMKMEEMEMAKKPASVPNTGPIRSKRTIRTPKGNPIKSGKICGDGGMMRPSKMNK